MMKRMNRLAAAMLLLAPSAFAAALFEPGQGVLTLPAVKVGNAQYTDVRLGLIDAASYTFRLQAATLQSASSTTDIVFDGIAGTLTVPFVSVGRAAYNIRLRLIDAASYTFTLSAADLVPAGSKLYFGYYLEDPATNPEDPTIGSLLLSFPGADASFSGLMPFSYVGCSGQADIGTVGGERVGATVTGNWTGKVDTTAVGGTYTGGYDAVNDTYSGSFVNAGGKVRFGGSTCFGFVAPKGTWKVFGDTTNSPASFVLRASTGRTPQLSWPSMGAALYYIRVFDETCLKANPANPACFKGETVTSGVTLAYPSQFPGAAALVTGGKYLALIAAKDAASSALLGFSSLRLQP